MRSRVWVGITGAMLSSLCQTIASAADNADHALNAVEQVEAGAGPLGKVLRQGDDFIFYRPNGNPIVITKKQLEALKGLDLDKVPTFETSMPCTTFKSGGK